MSCPECSKDMAANSKFCGFCGEKIEIFDLGTVKPPNDKKPKEEEIEGQKDKLDTLSVEEYVTIKSSNIEESIHEEKAEIVKRPQAPKKETRSINNLEEIADKVIIKDKQTENPQIVKPNEETETQ